MEFDCRFLLTVNFHDHESMSYQIDVMLPFRPQAGDFYCFRDLTLAANGVTFDVGQGNCTIDCSACGLSPRYKDFVEMSAHGKYLTPVSR